MKPCLTCGTPSEGSRCAAHRYLEYRGWRWEQLSKRMRYRQGCAVCGTTVATTVHHRIPLSQGGDEWAPENLQVLCWRHHGEAHNGKIRGA
jgi:5-methylcytosine-specific restriction endonuclease McrA